MSQELENLRNTDPDGGHEASLISGGPKNDGKGREFNLYKVYKWRWYVLTTLAMLNFSNAMAWICFAVVTNTTAAYYNVSVDSVNWLSLIFLVVTVPIGFVGSWAIDTLGLRAAMLFGGWVNLLGLILRYLSTLETVPDSGRFAIVMTGQGFSAFAQPFLLFAPTKLAATWFPDQQRAIANTFGSMANPIGILSAFFLSSGLVSKPSDIPFMLWVYIIPGGVAAAMVTIGICSSTPSTPPTASAASKHESFFQGLKKCVKNLPYMVLFLCFGGGYGLFNALSTFLEQIVCPQGYNDDYAGLIGGLMILCGILGAIISGLYVDRTKHFTPVVKTTFTLAVLFGIIFIVCAQFPKLGIGMAVGAVGFGFFGFAMFPIALELGVECTYPVPEGCSAGILQISGQFQGIILIMIGQFAAQQMPVEDAPYQQCVARNSSEIAEGDELVTKIPNMSIPLYIFAGYAILSCLLLLVFFKTEYKRVLAEGRESFMKKTIPL